MMCRRLALKVQIIILFIIDGGFWQLGHGPGLLSRYSLYSNNKKTTRLIKKNCHQWSELFVHCLETVSYLSIVWRRFLVLEKSLEDSLEDREIPVTSGRIVTKPKRLFRGCSRLCSSGIRRFE
jgi:hypothetical protein